MGFVQWQLTEAMINDTNTPPDLKDRIEKLRRTVLEVEPGAQIPPRNLAKFQMVCSHASVTVTKKAAFVELRVHARATQDPENPATVLRELFHDYLASQGEVQLERAPAPATRDIRTALTKMGYGKGKGKGSA